MQEILFLTKWVFQFFKNKRSRFEDISIKILHEVDFLTNLKFFIYADFLKGLVDFKRAFLKHNIEFQIELIEKLYFEKSESKMMWIRDEFLYFKEVRQ